MAALLPRAQVLLAAIQTELKKRDRIIEQDNETTKITLELILGKRSGNPVKIRFIASSECDLTAAPS